jgi:hypothetical protein
MSTGNVLDQLPYGSSTAAVATGSDRGRSRRFITLVLPLEPDAFQHCLVGWLEALEI